METAHIYKIVCKDENIKEFYIGSTFNLSDRIRQHKYKCKNSTVTLYKYISDNGGWINFNVIILETFECDSETKDKVIKEQEYINKLNPTLNDIRAYATKEQNYKKSNEYYKEWAVQNKTKLKDYNIEYRQKNKDKLSQQKATKVTCECGSVVSRNNFSTHLKSKKHLQLIKM
tara:strand:- start:1758 stop:2276 length:519 start_codon:yes stop_codon:yes gene_type:complete